MDFFLLILPLYKFEIFKEEMRVDIERLDISLAGEIGSSDKGRTSGLKSGRFSNASLHATGGPRMRSGPEQIPRNLPSEALIYLRVRMRDRISYASHT